MSNRNNMIPIPGRLHSVAVGEPVSGADEVLDDALNMEQSEINQLTVGTKNASTGTTGAYPYNGMGRVVLPKNMVNGVNTLTQDMLYKGDPGSRVPNTNTIFVIQYDYVLGEDITSPSNCVLEFDGGSISGNKTITGASTGIKAGLIKIFNTDITLAGTWNVSEAYPEWFGAVGDGIVDDHAAMSLVLGSNISSIVLLSKNYTINGEIAISNKSIIGNGVTIKALGKSRLFIDNSSIDNVIFDIDNHSVERAFLIFQSGNCYLLNSIVKNIAGVEFKDGAYAVTVYIETCSSHIYNCQFIEISDRRRNGAAIGTYDNGGFTGAIYYRPNESNNWGLTNYPKPQYAERCYIDKCRTLKEDGTFDSSIEVREGIQYGAYDADAIRVYVQIYDEVNIYLDKQFYQIKDIVINNVQKRTLKLSGAYNVYAENIRCNELSSNYNDCYAILSIMDCENINLKNYLVVPPANSTVVITPRFINVLRSSKVIIDTCNFNGINYRLQAFEIEESNNVVIKNIVGSGNIKFILRASNNGALVFNANFEGSSQITDNSVPFIDSASNDKINISGNYLLQQGIYVIKESDSKDFSFDGLIDANAIPFIILNVKNSVNIKGIIKGSCGSTLGIPPRIFGSSNSYIPNVNIDLVYDIKPVLNSASNPMNWLSLNYINYAKCNISAIINYENIVGICDAGFRTQYIDLLDLSINKFIANNLPDNYVYPFKIVSSKSNVYVSNDVTITNKLIFISVDSDISSINTDLPEQETSYNYIHDISRIKYYKKVSMAYFNNAAVNTGVIKNTQIARTTDKRPTLKTTDAGYSLLDTTIGRPIWWNGSAWVDATGTPV